MSTFDSIHIRELLVAQLRGCQLARGQHVENVKSRSSLAVIILAELVGVVEHSKLTNLQSADHAFDWSMTYLRLNGDHASRYREF
jgi:hypothetical protein